MTTKSTCLKETQRMRKIPPYPPLQKGGWGDFRSKRLFALFAAAFCIFISTFAAAQEEGGSDKTLSPYFFVKSESPEIDQLPLKSTSAGKMRDTSQILLVDGVGLKISEPMWKR